MASSARHAEIVAAARSVLEEEGPSGLTMQAVAGRLGIRAPSLYKHVSGKAELEAALAAEHFAELVQAGRRARTLEGAFAAYRRHAIANDALYRLTTEQPLPRDLLPEGLEDAAAAPLTRLLPDPDLARAAWAFAHGMIALELAGRFPPSADLDAAWRAGAAAFDRTA